MPAPRRLLTIGHSYCVELNRRLPQELARNGNWEVTAVAPARWRGDFGWHTTAAGAAEACRVVPVPVRRTGRPFKAGRHTLPPFRGLAVNFNPVPRLEFFAGINQL